MSVDLPFNIEVDVLVFNFQTCSLSVVEVLVKKVKPFAPSDKVCKLCLQEKLAILRSAPSLNKRSKNFGHCTHRKKNSCLAILTSQRQPMRSPCRPKLKVLTKDLLAKYF